MEGDGLISYVSHSMVVIFEVPISLVDALAIRIDWCPPVFEMPWCHALGNPTQTLVMQLPRAYRQRSCNRSWT